MPCFRHDVQFVPSASARQIRELESSPAWKDAQKLIESRISSLYAEMMSPDVDIEGIRFIQGALSSYYDAMSLPESLAVELSKYKDLKQQEDQNAD